MNLEVTKIIYLMILCNSWGIMSGGGVAALTIDDKVIGHHIRIARKKAKLTQSTCSVLLNVSTSYYSRIECGKVHLNLERLYQICLMLKTKPEFILAHCCQELDAAEYDAIDNPTLSQLQRIIDTAPQNKLDMMLSVCKAIYEQSDAK